MPKGNRCPSGGTTVVSTGDKAVAAGYVVLFAGVLASIVIAALKLDRLAQKVASLTDALTGREPDQLDKRPPTA